MPILFSIENGFSEMDKRGKAADIVTEMHNLNLLSGKVNHNLQ